MTRQPASCERPAAALPAYQNVHAGETFIVCGCGESLRGFQPPAGVVTIGVNDVGRQFTPDYLVVVNPPSQFQGDRFQYVRTSQARAIFTQLELGLAHERVIRFRLGKRGGTDFLDPQVLPYTQNSPYVAVCLAALMGARRIGLVGVDLTAGHFFGGEGAHPLSRQLPRIDAEYAALHQALAARGVELVNLSTVSRLTALPRVSPDQFSAPPTAPAARPRRVFFVHYRFLSCGDVFATGLDGAAEALGLAHEGAFWDDRELPRKIRAFAPDLVFVVHGRRCAQRWGPALREWKSAVWLLDEPYEVDDTARWSSVFGTVFVNDPATLGRHAHAHYLPVCFDPSAHFDPGGPRDYAVGFIGGYNAVRERYLVRLAQEGLLSYVVGGPWKAAVLNQLRLAANISPAATARLYQRTKIVLNVFRSVHHFNRGRLAGTAPNPRVFEALACGALVVSEPRPLLAETFPELPTFQDEESLVSTVRELLGDPARAATLLAASRARLASHDYSHRLAAALEKAPGAVVPPPPALPRPIVPGWSATGTGTLEGDAADLVLTARPSHEICLVSEAAANDVELAFALRLDAQAHFIAKIHHQAPANPNANSYHLISTPVRSYLARHDRILAEVRIARGSWQQLRLRWVDQRLELFVNGRRCANVGDNLLESGYSVVGITAGRGEVRGLALRDLSEGPTLPPAAAGLSALPFTGQPRRNLIYHVWPVRGGMWRWNVEQLRARIGLFNGRRIIGIVHDGRSEKPEEVRQMFAGLDCEFVEARNGPLGEGLTFPAMLSRVRSLEPDEVTFYAHAKGVKYEPAVPAPVRRWAETQYRVTLDDWPAVQAQLERFAMTGSFKMLGRFRAHRYAGDWHYSGTFFWLRHAFVFAREVTKLPAFYGCVEAWPGVHFRREETGCLFLDNLRQLPYHEEFWRKIGEPELMRWETAHPAPAPCA